MVTITHCKHRRRKALVLALAMCCAAGANAQTNTAGSIAGHAASGDTITISNQATGFSRTITVGSDGNYRFSQLPTGQYQVNRNGGAQRTVSVSVGTNSNVDFVGAGDATTLDTVTVMASASVNPVDVSSVESTTILTAEQIKKIPVPTNTTAVALLAPGTVRGDAAFGNLASFGGSSVAENQYYLNGFNITNSFRGLNFAQVPFEGIEEQQVKTGGYGAEFGRSLGGVVNQITKRGTNDFHAGANLYWFPESLTEPNRDLTLSNPLHEDVGNLWVDNRKNNAWSVTTNVWASGALVKDKLFAYALFSVFKQDADVWLNTESNINNRNLTRSNKWLLKLDWNINDAHTLEFTGFSDKQNVDADTYFNTVGELDRLALVGTNVNEQGGDNYSLKYTGYLTDSFTLSALAGYGKFSRANYLVLPSGEEVAYDGNFENGVGGCPSIFDNRPAARQAATGGYVSQCNITGGLLQRGDSGDTRKQFRLDGEWQLGSHLVRFGYDRDDYTSVAGAALEGGVLWTYLTLANGQDIAQKQITSQGSTVKVKQHAYYIEDSWNITDNFIAYIGGRWDTFQNLNGDGDTYVHIKNQFGPRLGFSWDVLGDSSFKVFGNAGRYALPLTPSVAVRGASASVFSRETFTFAGVDPVTGVPINPVSRGDFRYLNSEDGHSKDPDTIASANLKPMYQDEFILGFQKQLTSHLSVGARTVFRDLKAAIDDNCDYAAVLNSPDSGFTFDEDHGWWYDADGNGAVLPNAGFPYCRMFNPGDDAVFITDFLGDGNKRVVHVPGELLSPKAKRTYSAFEFFFEGNWDRLFLQGSYTFAKSKGNTEGGVKSDIGQADTNVTQDFDYLALTVDTYGYLPNDRRHSFKLFGNYELSEQWAVGFNVLLQSGRPKNCFGLLDLDPRPPLYDANGNPIPDPASPATRANPLRPYHFLAHPYGSNFMRCGTTTFGGLDDNTVVATPRGAVGRLPWTSQFDLNLVYKPSWMKGLQMKVDVFNILNTQKATAMVENAEVRATGLPSRFYGLPVNNQFPRSVRFMVQYDF